ncbi:MAG: DNA polymerase III subunit gamma/tau, partial [Psychrobacillus sp.]
ISRTQRFDFKRITAQAIVGRMKWIIEETGLACDEKALQVIARAAEGGMRDALSLLDQAISFSQDQVTVEDALTVTGSVSQTFLNQLARAVHERDAASGLEALEELLYQGKDPARFIEDFIYFYRDMLLYKAAPNLEESLERVLLDEDFQRLASEVDTRDIYEIIDGLNKAQQEMRWTNHPRVFLEVAVVKLCQLENHQPPISGDMEPLLQRLVQLEEKLARYEQNPPQASVQNEQSAQKKPQRANRKGFQAATGKINEVLKNATKQDLQTIKSRWGEMREQLVARQMRSQAALLNDAEPVA